jgi:hypothetical protein
VYLDGSKRRSRDRQKGDCISGDDVTANLFRSLLVC